MGRNPLAPAELEYYYNTVNQLYYCIDREADTYYTFRIGYSSWSYQSAKARKDTSERISNGTLVRIDKPDCVPTLKTGKPLRDGT